ncbi:hypothetical protein CIB48_g5703 [Xylaria polymorpha]|nr:hypothetical protein CIB48_g5703 [Xylaria polymorpha]
MAVSSNNNPKDGTSHHTIEDFGLIREPTVWEPNDTSFIDPYLVYASLNECSSLRSSPPSLPEWSSYKITLPQGSQSPKLLNGYAVSPSHHAYVTFCVQLLISPGEDERRRLTGMRYRDMIADNFVSVCPLAKLRWLGVANIMHAGSRATFTDVFRLAGRDIRSRGEVEVRPDVDLSDNPELRSLLLNDPFMRGVFALLHRRAKELGHAFVRRFIFISEGYEGTGDPSPLELRLNLVVELARPGDGDVGDGASVIDDVLKAPLANL